MPDYIITSTQRYKVNADSEQQALDSFQVRFNEIPVEELKTDPQAILLQDWFDYLDGTDTVEEETK